MFQLLLRVYKTGHKKNLQRAELQLPTSMQISHKEAFFFLILYIVKKKKMTFKENRGVCF